MGAVTPGETLGTLYNIHVGSNKTKQHAHSSPSWSHSLGWGEKRSLLRSKVNVLLETRRERERFIRNYLHNGVVSGAAR